jgi:predicted nucleotidyltransferase
MKNAAVLRLFKKLVAEEGLSNARVYLFGSRARQDCAKDSDWDFLIVSEKTLSPRKKMDIRRSLSQKFHNIYFSPVDVIVRDKKTFSWEKKLLNTISYAAVTEGMTL